MISRSIRGTILTDVVVGYSLFVMESQVGGLSYIEATWNIVQSHMH